jgi:hypothetical protein
LFHLNSCTPATSSVFLANVSSFNFFNKADIVTDSWHYKDQARFQVHTAANMNMTVFCDVANVFSQKSTDVSEVLTASIIRGTHRPDEGSKHFRNVGKLLRDYTAYYPRRLSSSLQVPNPNSICHCLGRSKEPVSCETMYNVTRCVPITRICFNTK